MAKSLNELEARKLALEYMSMHMDFYDKDIANVAGIYAEAVMSELEAANIIQAYIGGRKRILRNEIVKYLLVEIKDIITEREQQDKEMLFQKNCMEESLRISKRANHIAVAALIVSILSAGSIIVNIFKLMIERYSSI